MNQLMRGMVRSATETFAFPGPILEIGSYQVENQEKLIELRALFPGREYTGLDFRAGPGVDVVANAEDMPFPDHSFGTVLAMNVLEHIEHFWLAMKEMHRVLRPDGTILLCCPFYFHIHSFPNDYWRFTPEALRMLLSGFPNKLIGWHGLKTRPAHVWAYATREAGQTLSTTEYHLFKARMNEYSRLPLPWFRKLRYRLGRLVCGSRPVAPWLSREKWDAVLYQDSSETSLPLKASDRRAA